MKYERAFYLTKDKQLDIEFMFIDLGPIVGWRGYVLSDINYKMFSKYRSDEYTDTHLFLDVNMNRYIDPNKDYPYICWTKPIHDLGTMKELAAMWAEITAYYIKYGGSFTNIQKILEDKGVI